MKKQDIAQLIGKAGVGVVLLNQIIGVSPAAAEGLSADVRKPPASDEDDAATEANTADQELRVEIDQTDDNSTPQAPEIIELQKREIATSILELFGEDLNGVSGIETEDLVGKAYAVTILNADMADVENVQISISADTSEEDRRKAIASASELSQIAGISISPDAYSGGAFTTDAIEIEYARFSVDDTEIAQFSKINGLEVTTYISMDMSISALSELQDMAKDIHSGNYTALPPQHVVTTLNELSDTDTTSWSVDVSKIDNSMNNGIRLPSSTATLSSSASQKAPQKKL